MSTETLTMRIIAAERSLQPMSAIDREKLLELIKSRKTKLAGSYKDIEYGAYMELETIEAYIESGAFDVREKEPQDTSNATGTGKDRGI